MKGLKGLEIVVFDVETTGLSPYNGDRIVEIAILKIRNFKVTDRYETFINPLREISYGAFLVNGITKDMIKDAPVVSKVIPEIINFMKGSCLVGHNVRFDLGFLNNEFQLEGYSSIDHPAIIDTVRMSRGLMPSLPRHSLSSVAYALGVKEEQQHRAMADVEMTCRIFFKLLTMAHQKGIDDFSKIVDMFGLLSMPARTQAGEKLQ